MIGVEELIYDIDLKLNKVATFGHQAIAIEDKLIALNDAQIALIKSKVVSFHPGAYGLDSYKKRYEDLQLLFVPHKELAIKKDAKSFLNRYVAPITVTFTDYLFYIDSYFLCSNQYCSGHHVKGFRVKHADLQVILTGANTCPSFSYQEMPVTVSNNSLECYSDGTFQVDRAFLSYLRYPRKINIEGFIDFDGAPSITSDCELPYYLKDEVVNLAVEQLAVSTENSPAAGYVIPRNQQTP